MDAQICPYRGMTIELDGYRFTGPPLFVQSATKFTQERPLSAGIQPDGDDLDGLHAVAFTSAQSWRYGSL